MKKLVASLFFCVQIFLFCSARQSPKHFILGFTPESSSARLARVLKKRNGYIRHALFSPDEDLRQVLIGLIDSEEESIKLAVYFLTDKAIVHALVRAQRRGVHVVCITDQQCLKNRYGKVGLLRRYRVPVAVYQPAVGERYRSLMHHKFVVFGKNINDRSLVWTGSFNFTRAARVRNQENAIVSDDEYLVKRFAQQFEKLRTRTKRQTNSKEAIRSVSVRRPTRGFRRALRSMRKSALQKS